jgi:hypothetical protein
MCQWKESRQDRNAPSAANALHTLTSAAMPYQNNMVGWCIPGSEVKASSEYHEGGVE